VRSDRYDVAVIGAGPAGLAAACEAAETGASIVVLDEQPAPGGQIYRAVETPRAAAAVLGDDYAAGARLVARFRACRLEYVPRATVWQVSPDRAIGVSVAGRARLITAAAVIIATGAIERPFPVPGWTLPGVMTAGAAQIVLKTAGYVAPGAVFVGQGPLLYLVAAQYLRAGVEVGALLDTTDRSNLLAAIPHLPGAWLAGPHLGRGLAYLREIRAAGVKTWTGISDIRITGEDRVTGVEFRRGRRRSSAAAEHVLLHQGIVPNVNLSRSIGCRHVWDEAQLAWRVATDEWGRTSVAGVYVAGDAAHVGGAEAAACRGRLAGLDALTRLGHQTEEQQRSRSRGAFRALRRELKVRRFLDELYRPLARFRVPTEDEVIVCRCEEVTAGEIRLAASLGCLGPNQLKSYCRAGMGACQGRECALTVTELIATLTRRPAGEVGDFRRRPPIKPVRLEELAALAGDSAAASPTPVTARGSH
jgi:NADPH-dependent 2,4-dienoyl-CoA reductase/sulfur reductase-like enzyme